MPIKCPVKRGNYKCSYPHCSQNTTPYTLTPKPTAPQNPKNPSATPQQPASIPISLPIPKATPVRDPASQSSGHRDQRRAPPARNTTRSPGVRRPFHRLLLQRR